jgi:hypothetical protein
MGPPPPTKEPPQTGPSTVRQLSEVDLGTSAQALNLARTQAALERAKLGQPPIPEEARPSKPRKPRLGRDGKPMRPRPRKPQRRNSEDLARDALVERVMHENKIDIYDAELATAAADVARDAADDAGTDEQFAEQFRQQFFDAMAERTHRHRAAPPQNNKNQPAAPVESRGPKLGGSRSARAKMAQMRQQEQAAGQGPGGGQANIRR